MLEIEITVDDTKDNLLIPHPYTHLNQIDETSPDETMEAVFMYGRCHVYALVLKRFNPDFQLQAIYRDEDFQHVYCINLNTQQVLDATGTYDSLEQYMDADVINRYLLTEHKPVTVEEIFQLVESNTLVPLSHQSLKLASFRAEMLNQIS